MKNNRKHLMGIVTVLIVTLAACGNPTNESSDTSDNSSQNNKSTQNANDNSINSDQNQDTTETESDDSEKPFDVENYLTDNYLINNTHYKTDAWENENTGRIDYTVNILPDNKEFGQQINEILRNGHNVSPYEDERTENMFNMAEKIMNELPKVNNKIHVDSVNWVSFDGEFVVTLIQDYENSDLNADKKKEYLKKLNDTKKEQDDIRRNSKGEITYVLKKVEGDRFDVWDGLLNEIYEVLQKQLPSKEMEQLRKEQRKWITYRDKSAKEASLKYKGGTMEQLEYTTVLNNLTEERCFELVENYMN
jgi:uncharacterized protein YecT (DUF1311 family)